MTDLAFDVTRFETECKARRLRFGLPVSWRNETQSTNDDALAAAKSGAPHGAVFGAEAQTRGRGRRGSEWLSAPGAGLCFSVLLRPELSAELLSGVSLCAGLAVRAAVAPLVTAPVLVKWPNDVLAAGRKLSGILVESQVSGSEIASVIIGIGINVTQTAFPDELTSVATSLTLLAGMPLDRERLLADVLSHLETELTRLTRHGLAGVSEALQLHDALRGRRLRVDSLEGVGSGTDAAGRLLLRQADGQLVPVVSGHVEQLD